MGVNNLGGNVNVSSLPSLPAGNNNIGDVDVVSLPSIPAGSNDIGNVRITGHSYSRKNNTGSTTVKSSAGVLHSLVIGDQGASATITIYDNTTNSGTIISVIKPTSPTSLVFDVAFGTGLTIDVAATAAPDITVSYR